MKCDVCKNGFLERLFRYKSSEGQEIKVCEDCENLTNYDHENDRHYLDFEKTRYFYDGEYDSRPALEAKDIPDIIIFSSGGVIQSVFSRNICAKVKVLDSDRLENDNGDIRKYRDLYLQLEPYIKAWPNILND